MQSSRRSFGSSRNERVELRSLMLLMMANGMPVTLIRVGEAMRACGLVDAGDESRASGCARRRRAMGAPFGSAICAKRKRSFPARDCFENPGASLMSESSSLGSCRSSTSLAAYRRVRGGEAFRAAVHAHIALLEKVDRMPGL